MIAPTNRKNLQLAVYGKGGIGKSTIAANLSAAFASMGKSVLQVGCDPKHDSTRLLLGGWLTQTVLEHLDNPLNQSDLIRHRRRLLSPDQSVAEVVAAGSGLPEGLDRQSVLHKGFGGVMCIEAGGPRPGVGCAGRGIITTFELLQKLKVDPKEFDVVIYDVLGDVVCGGFGVPMRREYANAILLVAGEEYMPIFAANNILRGVKNYDRQEARLAGLFLNRRSNESSTALIDRFAANAGLPIVARLPRSPVVQQADHRAKTLAEAFADSAEAEVFRSLAKHLLAESSQRYPAKPVTDEELERVVLGRNVSATPSPRGHSEPLDARAALDVHTPCAAWKKERATQGEPRRLAVYGKGGIGKSTVAANISATLGARGLRVLQIGCDPKHDSTRLLLGGRTARTVLEYLRDVKEADHRLDEVVHEGIFGVDCVEVGGPEPGVGCAGRGILSAFTLLEKLGLRENDYDVIVYDVLGDVVCGGFAIPLRKGYAQSVLLVTSEEYMPLYAANNILRGINGVTGTAPKVLGVFHNVRDNAADMSTVERFVLATGLPVVSKLERSELVQEAEQCSSPLAAHAPLSAEAKVFAQLSDHLMDGAAHYAAAPLDDTQLDQIVLGRETVLLGQADEGATRAPGKTPGLTESSLFTQAAVDLRFCNFEQAPHEPYFYRRKPIRQPIWGCAFQSAVRLGLRLRDAVVVAHAPRSCVYMCRTSICSSASKSLKRKKKLQLDNMAPNLVSTDMTVPNMIYGGTELLAQTLKDVLADKPPVVFLATACPPAIIGDDIVEAIRQAQPVSPETRIIPLRTDGNMTGGGMNGYLSAFFDGLLALVDASSGPVEPMSVNLISDWEHNRSEKIKAILSEIGLKVNTSFTADGRDARAENLRNLPCAPLTLMADTNLVVAITAKHLKERFGTRLSTYAFPKGFRETALWLRDIGEFFGIQERVEQYLPPHQAAYEQAVVQARRTLAGKRVVVFTHGGRPIDWMFDVMIDCGMDIAMVGVMMRREDLHYPSRYWDSLPVEFSFHPDRRQEVVRQHCPHAVFIGPRNDLPGDFVALDSVGVKEGDIGFGPGISLIKRWTRLMAVRVSENWRRDFVPADKRTAALKRPALERTTA